MARTVNSKSSIVAMIAAVSIILDRFSATVFLPALPFLSASLAVSRDEGQLVYTTYLFGVTVSQSISGYFADLCGYKVILLLLLPLYAAGTIIAAASPDFYLLLLGMVIQGLGMGGIFSISQALVGFRFGKKNAAKALAYITLFVSWSPALGPIIGGSLTHHLGWRSSFLFLAILTLLIAPLFLLLPKPKESHLKSFSFISMLRDYFQLYSKRDYLKFALNVAFMNAGLVVFFTISPFLVITDLHYSARAYGYFIFIPISGIMLGRFLCTQFCKFFTAQIIIQLGNVIAIFGATSLVITAYTKYENAWTIMFSMAIYLTGLGLSVPQARAGAMYVMVAFIGTAASLLSVTVNVFSAAHSYLAARVVDQFMAWYILTISVVNILLYSFLDYPILKKSN